MSAATHAEPTHIPPSDTEAELKRHGIREVPANFYEYGGYRYTNVKDAIAEALRHPGAKAQV